MAKFSLIRRFFRIFKKPKPKLGFTESLKEEAIKARQPILITLHGTWAADEEDDVPVIDSEITTTDPKPAQRWWHRGSEFLTKLQEKVTEKGGQTFFTLPFHWDGQNVDSSRLKAARALAKSLNEFEKNGLDYSIVTHSHGGNVFMKSLHVCRTRFFETQPELKKLNKFISVGSPFFGYKRKYAQFFLIFIILFFVIAWLAITGFYLVHEVSGTNANDDISLPQALAALALFIATLFVAGSKKIGLKPSFAIAVCAAIVYAIIINMKETQDFFIILLLSIINFGSLILGWTLSQMILARMIEPWKNKWNIERVKLSEKGMSIISHRDEVMALLSNTVSQKLTLIYAKTVDKRLSGFLESAGIIAIPIIILDVFTAFNFFNPSTYPLLLESETYGPIGDIFSQDGSEMAGIVALLTVLGVGALYLSVQVLKIIIRYSGIYYALAKAVNVRTRQTLKGAAFGDDSEWFVKSVKKIPFHIDTKIYQLLEITREDLGGITPEDILNSTDKIHQFVEDLNSAVPTHINKPSLSPVTNKDVILSKKKKTKKDMQETLKESVLKMLYHNAYFKDEDVIEAIAAKLVEAKV